MNANSLWVEKYRPKKIEDLVLSDQVKEEFTKIIETKTLPNVIMHGNPGSGKSTFARILISKRGVIQDKESNVLEINGSAKETRGISFVQDVIEPFLKVPPFGSDKYKVVFIDEADYLTDASFHSLRGIIEKYTEYARFILTCNYVSKVPDAVLSRFQGYAFKQLPKEYVTDYCSNILTKEKIEYQEKDLKFVIDNLYPDIRRIVNKLQQNSITGKLRVDSDSILTNEKKIILFITEIIQFVETDINGNNKPKVGKHIQSIVSLLNDIEVEYRSIYTELFFNSKIPVTSKIVVNQYSNSHSSCLVPSMHFLSMVYKIIEIVSEYKKKIGK